MPKLIDKIRHIFSTKAAGRTELGASGTTIFGGIIDTEEYVADLKGDKLIETINKMRWSDATVKAALLAVTLPILSADWDVIPASEDPQDIEIADVIKENLFQDLAWESLLREILLYLPFGFYTFEKVFKLVDGLFLWKKWAPRLPKTIQKWNMEKGELVSVEQRVYKNESYETITIPVEKLLNFTNEKEGDNFRGTSILRQGYKHWYFRDKYYRIDAIATERHGVGVPVITLPAGYSPQDKEEADELGSNLRSNEQSHITRPSDKWTIEMLDMKTSTLKDPQKMLDHHTREILKSVLAQFLELGQSTGSWALNEGQMAFFVDGVDAAACYVEDVINKYAIQQLVDLNWTVETYPKLTHGDLGVVDIEKLSTALQSLSLVGMVTPDPEMERYLRNILKLPEPPEDFGVSTPAPKTEELETEKEKVEKEEKTPEKKLEKKTEKKMSERWHRQLTKAEQAVRFDEIKRVMTSEESVLFNELSKILIRERAYLMPRFERAVQNNDLAALQNISGRFKGEYERVFRNGIKKLFEYGKNKAAFEIKKPAPSTTGEKTGELYDQAHYYAERHYKDLIDNLKSAASMGVLDKTVSVTDTIKNVKNTYQKFINRSCSITANLSVAESFNEGRKYSFDTYSDDVYGYQWSAILDGATCFPAGTKVTTDRGDKNIESIKTGDKVLTRGGFRQVMGNGVRDYEGLMVKVSSPKGRFVCTEDHPVFADGEFKEAKYLSIGDTLVYSRNNILFKVADGVYNFLRKSQYLEPIANKVFGFLNIFRFISVPVTAVNFYTNSEFGDVEINGVPTNTRLLFEGIRGIFKGVSKLLFKPAFAVKSAIAGNTTKDLISRRGLSKGFPAYFTFNNNGGASTFFGAIMSHFTRVTKSFAASFTDSIFSVFRFTLQRAEIISTSVGAWYRELLTAPDANFNYSLASISTSKRAEFITTRFDRAGRAVKDFATTRTGGIFSRSRGFMVTLQRAKLGISAFVGRLKGFTAELTDVAHQPNYSINVENGRPLEVYNLEVGGAHEYFANGVLVHNCNYCRSMDGKVISGVDKKFSSYQPGRVHFNCRCIWVAILKGEEHPPAFTGIPNQLKPQTEVPPWEFKDLNAPLPGSTHLEIEDRLMTPAMQRQEEILYGKNTYREGVDRE